MDSSGVEATPTQARAVRALLAAAARHPVVQLAAGGGPALTPGFGHSTALRLFLQAWPADAPGRPRFLGVAEGLEGGAAGLLRAAAAAWEGGAQIVVVDDIDLAACPSKIFSNRLGSTGGKAGESMGFTRAAAEPVMLLKALADLAASVPGRCLVFRAFEEHFSRFMGAPFVVSLPPMEAADYAHLLRRWLPAATAATVDAEEIFSRFPSLTPAELRVACAALCPGLSPELPGEEELSTEHVVESISSQLGEAHGAIRLEEVEAVDLAAMPGLGKVVDVLEKQLIVPFEKGLEGTAHAEPKAGVLLFGPPGVGKTSIGRALAHRLKGKVFRVREVWALRDLVETFARAEANAPSVVFFDDIDVLLHRSKVAWGGGEMFRFLLSKMDGMTSYRAKNGKHVTIIMTCESPKTLPEALVRSGRIELWLKLERPTGRQRWEILQKLAGECPEPELRGVPSKELRAIADRTEEFSPADLRRCVKDAVNALAFQRAKGRPPQAAGELLEEAAEDLRKMRDHVDSFMKQIYH